MREINEHHSFIGMQRDLVCSKHPVNLMYDARNIRLTSRGESTMLAITNEKGTCWQLDVIGTYIGHALLGKYLVVFTKSGGTSYIRRINLEDITIKTLYSGALNFDVNHPITTLPFYENENIQKVYWVDGLNQPRLINIVGDIESGIDTQFDFIRELQLNESVHITKLYTGGYFPSGVIQYAFTYVNKYAQESNIFYISPLFYISPKGRGAAPDESVFNSFKINIQNPDENFSIIRVYSIQRTSIDGTAITKRVKDIQYKNDYVRTLVSSSRPTYAVRGTSTPTPTESQETIMGNTVNAIVLDNSRYGALELNTSEGMITWSNDTISTDRIAISKTRGYFNGVYGYGIQMFGNGKMVLTDYNPYDGISTIDTGTTGDAIDPTELLYKGNNSVIANTITQKDNTLFFGGISIDKASLIEDATREKIKTNYFIDCNTSSFIINSDKEAHEGILSVSRGGHTGVYSAGFKHGEYYRLGIQFQHKNGSWTDPIYLTDKQQNNRPSISGSSCSLPTFRGGIYSPVGSALIEAGFKKLRPVVVFPKLTERRVLFQAVTCPTLYQDRDSIQSSWYFRHYGIDPLIANSLYCPGLSVPEFVPFIGNTNNLYGVEVEAYLDNPFEVDRTIQTLHSPDIEFDDAFSNITLNDVLAVWTGRAKADATRSAINIQTESGTISPDASGSNGVIGIGSKGHGLNARGCYSDYIADDTSAEDVVAYERETVPYKWYVYPWTKSGSLNNDTSRVSGKGAQSAVLKKKALSNIRYYNTEYSPSTVENLKTGNAYRVNTSLQVFNSDQPTVLKVDNTIYKGNIDTVLQSKESIGKYAYDPDYYYIGKSSNGYKGQWRKDSSWTLVDNSIGDYNSGLVGNRNTVRMKYKSSPHAVGKLKEWFYVTGDTENQLPIVDILNVSTANEERFGGTSDDAIRGNQWIPCGEPVSIKGNSTTYFTYLYGDTFFAQWDCLKTYAYTPEDENQLVEIGSFMLETRVNISGRYDRNTGQQDNTMMSPANFNLLNQVYSQQDNFFTYRILDKDYYNNSNYPNQVTWSKEKQAATDVDAWTNITLTSTYDMDGTKGKINHLTTFKDQIYCFQDKAVSTILFNSRVQIPTSDGVPIEISNSYKVDGHRTLSDGVGCSDGRLVCQTAASLYFIDSITNHLFSISDGLTDVSASRYMTSWFVNNKIDKLMYDNLNHDLYIVNDKESLCYSELLNQFTSFFDYDDINIIESYNGRVFTLRKEELHTMFEGEYNYFFKHLTYPAPNVVIDSGKRKPWYFTFISNGSDTNMVDFDKIFTNIDYRMDLSEIEEGEFKHSPHITFDYMQISDEYQDTGVVPVKRLMNLNASHWWDSFHHKETNTQKKFRIWRIQIPRALVWKTDRVTGERKQVFSNDRIRNPWCKITLGNYGKENTKALLHDLNVQYYI